MDLMNKHLVPWVSVCEFHNLSRPQPFFYLDLPGFREQGGHFLENIF